MEIILIIFFGFFSGIIGGMGMGGGTVLIPLLTIILKFGQQVSQVYNLLSFLPMAFICLIILIKSRLVELTLLPIIIGFGIVASFGGAILASILPGAILKLVFGFFLIAISIFQFYMALIKK